MKSLPEIIKANKEKEMIRMEDTLETAFEIRATPAADAPPGAYYLTLEHACDKAGTITGDRFDLGWVRCPWCSKRVPERIRRIFQK